MAARPLRYENVLSFHTGKKALDGIDTRIGLCLLNDRVILQAYLVECKSTTRKGALDSIDTRVGLCLLKKK
jgi:hypothetical protein